MKFLGYTQAACLAVLAVLHTTAGAALAPERRQDDDDSSSSPYLIFTGIQSLTTCESTTLNWAYTGPNSPLSLTITNVGVVQDDPPSSSSSYSRPQTFGNSARAIPTALRGIETSRKTIVELITDNVEPDSRSYTWSQVDVPQGWYTLYATMDAHSDFQAQAYDNFFVYNGSDTSCISGAGTSSSSSGSSAPTSSAPSTTSTPAASSTASEAASSSKVNTGAIAGGVVGGLAGLAAIIAAFIWFMCSRRRRRISSGSVRPHHRGGIMGRWGALGSFDSSHSGKKGQFSNTVPETFYGPGNGPQQHRQQGSLAPMMSEQPQFDPYSEKTAYPTTGFIPVTYSPSRPDFARHGSSTSGSSENYGRPRSTMLQTFPESPRPSTIMEATTPPQSSPGSSRRSSQHLDQVAIPEPMKRTGSNRKAQRKPVPSYIPEPSQESLPALSMSPSTTPSSQFHAPSPLQGTPRHSGELGGSHNSSVENVHSLMEKRSWPDGRPVHFLVPDMPPPQQ